MRRRNASQVPRQLRAAGERFAEWRRTRALGARIPESLWAVAIKSAAKFGLARTAAVLMLDYYGLKRRVEARSSPAVTAQHPVFVELPASTLAMSGECLIEFENTAGAKMRVHLKGITTPDLLALSRNFWSAK